MLGGIAAEVRSLAASDPHPHARQVRLVPFTCPHCFFARYFAAMQHVGLVRRPARLQRRPAVPLPAVLAQAGRPGQPGAQERRLRQQHRVDQWRAPGLDPGLSPRRPGMEPGFGRRPWIGPGLRCDERG